MLKLVDIHESDAIEYFGKPRIKMVSKRVQPLLLSMCEVHNFGL